MSTEAKEITLADVVILRAWRDGSVRAEVPIATFSTDDNDTFLTHLSYPKRPRFKTACGLDWWGKLSASGYGQPQQISCPTCRECLLALDER